MSVTDMQDDDDFDAIFDSLADGEDENVELIDDDAIADDSTDADDDDNDPPLEAGSGASQHADQEPTTPAAEPDAQQQTIQEMERELARERQRIRSEQGRTAALQRKLDELSGKSEAGANTAPGVDSHTAATAPASRGDVDDEDDDEVNAVPHDYPEIDKYLQRQLQPLRQFQETELESRQREQREREEAAEREFFTKQQTALTEAHPDVADVFNNPAYHSWLRNQPPAVQNAADSELASDAILVLNLFKQSSPRTSTAGLDDLPRNQVARGRGVAELPDNFDSAFDELVRRDKRRR